MMKILYPAIVLKNSFLFSGVLGIVLGFSVSYMMILYFRSNEVIISIGDLKADNNSTESPEMSTIRTATNRQGGKILCMVISALVGTKAVNVNNTWGRRCDKLIFLTSHRAYGLNTVLLPGTVKDTRATLWDKVSYGLSYAYVHHVEYDWFVKADDDTYIIMENLRMMLRGYYPSQALYFGCRFLRRRDAEQRLFKKLNTSSGYMSGGAGYVLSREALGRFVTHTRLADDQSWAEDINIASRLKTVNVKFVDTRDQFGRTRFHPINPMRMGLIKPRLPHNYWFYGRHFYRLIDGPNCCAESSITFHYIVTPFIELIDFCLYHLSPYQR